MPYILHTHWLWFFGAVALGVIVGWLTYLRAATAWTDRPVHLAIGAVVLGAIVAIAKVVPGRYGYWLELGVIFAVFYAAGCFVGWALRDLAEYMPAAAMPGATAGSYLFRDAHAGLATGDAYMRTAPSDGGLVRTRLPLPAASAGFDKAPVPGGYTFPATRRFADATTSQPVEPAPGLRRHWSWPRAEGAAPYVPTEFTGSKGGYVFPAAAPEPPHAKIAREGATAGGHYKHWSWRAAGPVETLATSALAAKTTAAGAAPAAATGASATAGSAAKPEFTGSKGGYVFPAVATAAPLATRDGKTRSGLYRHWSWRDTEAVSPATGQGLSTSPGAAAESPNAPIAPSSVATAAPSPAATETPAASGTTGAATAPGGAASLGAPGAPVSIGTPTQSPTAAGGLVGVAKTTAGPETIASPRPAMAETPVAGDATAGAPGAPGAAASPAAVASPSSPVASGSAEASTPSSAAPGIAAGAKIESGGTTAAPAPAEGFAEAGLSADGHGDSARASGATSPSDTVPGARTSEPAPVAPTSGSTATGEDAGTGGVSSATRAEPESEASSTGAESPAGAAAPSRAAPAGPGVSAASDGSAAPPAQASFETTGGDFATGSRQSPGGPAATTSISPTTDRPSAPAFATGVIDGGPDTKPATAGSAPSSAPAEVTAPDGPATALSGAADGAPAPTPPAPAGGLAASPPSPPSGVDHAASLATTTAGLPAAPPAAPGEPAVIAAVPGEDKHPGQRPQGLMTARDDRADDLKRIRGIGPQNEGRLHGLGIWHFDQIGAWTPENVRWVGSYLAFPGRIDREKWVDQAKVLAEGGDTEFSKRVRAGKVATKHDDGTFGQSNIADVSQGPRKPR